MCGEQLEIFLEAHVFFRATGHVDEGFCGLGAEAREGFVVFGGEVVW